MIEVSIVKSEILVVDDMELNRELLKNILQGEYIIHTAEDGYEAINILENNDNISVMLLDLMMPKMDGYAVLDYMNTNKLRDIPVIIISSDSGSQTEKKCFEYGVVDFISKPFNGAIVLKRIENVVKLFAYQNHLEQQVEKQTKLLKNQNDMLKRQAEKLSETNSRIIDILGTVVESRNLESGEHVKRVKIFTKILGMFIYENYPEYGLTLERVEMISQAAALHDIGKIAIPDSVLLKPGRLTDEEFEEMKTHTIRGHEILETIDGIWEDEYQQTSIEICRHHHERYDGRGYPDGLKGEDIPLSAQIVSVADVYDALVSERVYKSAFTKEEAFNMIMEGKCGQFSPKILDCFSKARESFEQIADAGKKK